MNAPTQPWVTESAPRAEDDNADQRLTRSAAPEVRGDYSIRQDAERTDVPNVSDDEIEQMLRDEYENNSLASPPPLPGFHLCWLTTTSQYDTTQKRNRLGYVPVMRSEMPDFDPSMGKEIEQYEGMISCNELILHKIPMRRYQVMMNLFHHKNPLASESAILQSIKDNNGKADTNGGEAESGIDNLERSVKVGSRLPEQYF